jgi:ArsR family metal-binding transcriptional regulator
MAVIVLPETKAVIDPNRPVNALLKAQIQHLQEAERVLPLKYHSEIYIRAIKTEGEAAEYIQEVTEAIHQAHQDAAARRKRRAAKQGVISIAAVASEGAARERRGDSGARATRKRATRKKNKS